MAPKRAKSFVVSHEREVDNQSAVVVTRKTQDQVDAMGVKTRSKWAEHDINSILLAVEKAQEKTDRDGVSKFLRKPSPKKEPKFSPGAPGPSTSTTVVSPATAAVSPGKKSKSNKLVGPL